MSEEIVTLSQDELDKLSKLKEASKKSFQAELKEKIAVRLSEAVKNCKNIDDSEATVRQEEVDALFGKDGQPAKKPTRPKKNTSKTSSKKVSGKPSKTKAKKIITSKKLKHSR